MDSFIESSCYSQGAKDLARPPTLSDVLHSSLEHAKRNQNSSKDEDEKEEDDDQNLESNKRGLKRKLDPEEVSDEQQKEFGKLNRAKNVSTETMYYNNYTSKFHLLLLISTHIIPKCK